MHMKRPNTLETSYLPIPFANGVKIGSLLRFFGIIALLSDQTYRPYGSSFGNQNSGTKRPKTSFIQKKASFCVTTNQTTKEVKAARILVFFLLAQTVSVIAVLSLPIPFNVFYQLFH